MPVYDREETSLSIVAFFFIAHILHLETHRENIKILHVNAYGSLLCYRYRSNHFIKIIRLHHIVFTFDTECIFIKLSFICEKS